jgi:cytidylate kinase
LGRRGAVMNGRDIGTVVFPSADFKFFLTATPEARAERRLAEERQLDPAATFEETLAEMTERDARDSTRADSPLVAAPDAVVIDTTGVPVEEVLRRMMREIDRRSQTAGG